MFEKMTTEVKIILGLMALFIVISIALIVSGNNTGKGKKPKETINITKDEGIGKKEKETETETKEEVPEVDPSEVAKSEAEDILSELSLHDKICQMFIATPEQLTGAGVATMAGDMTKSSIESYPIGGLVYFSQNIEDKEQITEMIKTTQEYAKGVNDVPMFIAVDEEGGTVARVADVLDTTKFNDMFSYKDEGTQTARNNAKTIASDISQFGFNLDFAPVCDVFSNSNNDAIGNRCYSDSFEESASLIENAVKGFNDGGVMCTLKHFPGIGDTDSDTHDGKVSSDKTIEELKEGEYLPFESGIDAGAQFVMVSHVVMSEIDEENPSSLSYTMVTQQLREELGYEGIVITDALNMGAITNTYSTDEATVAAIKAGVDIVLMPSSVSTAVDAVEKAVEDGTITEERIDESVLRILTCKCQYLK